MEDTAAQEGAAAAVVKVLLLARLLRDRGCGACHMARLTLESPPAAASDGKIVGAGPLAVGVSGSHGGSACRPVLLLGSVTVPGSGTRHDTRVRPGVSKECGSLLPMWRDAIRSLSVVAVAKESVLDALSANASVCESIERVAAVGFALLWKCGGDVACLVSVVGSLFFTPYTNGARVWY